MTVPFSGHGIIAGTFCQAATIQTTNGQIHRIEKYTDQHQIVEMDIANHYYQFYLNSFTLQNIRGLGIVYYNITLEI